MLSNFSLLLRHHLWWFLTCDSSGSTDVTFKPHSYPPTNIPPFMLRDNLWVAVLIILLGQLLSVLYYRVDMDIVLSFSYYTGLLLFQRSFILLCNWNLFISRAFWRTAECSASYSYSPSAKFNLSPVKLRDNHNLEREYLHLAWTSCKSGEFLCWA